LIIKHVWVDRKVLETQNMRFMCPNTLSSIVSRQVCLPISPHISFIVPQVCSVN